MKTFQWKKFKNHTNVIRIFFVNLFNLRIAAEIVSTNPKIRYRSKYQKQFATSDLSTTCSQRLYFFAFIKKDKEDRNDTA